MTDLNCGTNKPFKEAMCIEAMRIFDACSSQDCLEDLQFTFDTESQMLVNEASYIKCTCIEVTNVSFAVTPVAFNRGFYSVDVTYTFRAQIETYQTAGAVPNLIYGTSTFTKKVILFGSDGGTQHFSTCGTSMTATDSAVSSCACCCNCAVTPCASVNIAAPMCLDAKLEAAGTTTAEGNNVLITIGLFAIIQLSRPVQIMVPVYDYCLPGKECSTDSDTPCEMFGKIAFPTSEFFPKGLDEQYGCSCHQTATENES